MFRTFGVQELMICGFLLFIVLGPIVLGFAVSGHYRRRSRRATIAPPASVPAGWYADPANRHQSRYWDGIGWTANVADNGVQSLDSLGH